MALNFGDRSFSDPETKGKLVTPENWAEFRIAQQKFAHKALRKSGASSETHRILVLVDLQGVYFSLHKWLRDQDFPLEGGLVLSRFAFFQIYDVFERIKAQVLKSRVEMPLDFEDLMKEIRQAGALGKSKILVKKDALYLDFVPQFELFYAPVPFEGIEKRLEKQVKLGSPNARLQLDNLRSGIVMQNHWNEIDIRHYAEYADFVAKLKANPESSKSETGFFNFYVGTKGLQLFDEKEVDTRIVIRAMDSLYNYEADTLCVASSDQDYLPLYARATQFGIGSYQADLAKFRPGDKIGAKLKNLGSNLIRGRIDPSWPFRILIEASSIREKGLPAMYILSEKEVSALCDMHNSMNDVHLAVSFSPDGAVLRKIAPGSQT